MHYVVPADTLPRLALCEIGILEEKQPNSFTFAWLIKYFLRKLVSACRPSVLVNFVPTADVLAPVYWLLFVVENVSIRNFKQMLRIALGVFCC